MRAPVNICLVLVILCCVQLAPAQYDTLHVIPDTNIVKPLSIKALKEYRMLVVENNYQSLGFDSLEQVNYCALGQPMRFYTIGVDSLLFGYQPTVTKPRDLMGRGTRVLYPVTYNTVTRSGIICAKVRNEWVTVMHGAAPLAKAVTAMRDSVASSQSIDKNLFSAVEIPAMCIYFVAHASNNILYFTPILDYTEVNLIGGNTLTADSILTIISDYAISDTTRYQYPGP